MNIVFSYPIITFTCIHLPNVIPALQPNGMFSCFSPYAYTLYCSSYTE